MIEQPTRNIEMHVRLLAILTAVGTLFASLGWLLGSLILMPILFLLPFESPSVSGQTELALLGLGGMASVLAVGNLILGLSAAYGLLKRRPWGRVLGLVDSMISLLFFPLGTLFGAYGLWVLLPEDAENYFHCCDEFEFGKA